MNDAQNPEPETTDPEDGIVDPTTLTAEQVEQVQTGAKAGHSLKDRLLGISHRTARVPVFTDMEAVDSYNRLNERLQILADQAVRATEAGHKALLLAQFNDGEEELEKLKAQMLESALSVHLRAVPNAAVKIARRGAKKAYALPDGTIPTDKQDFFIEFIDTAILQAGIERIVDAHGIELDLDSDTAEDLSNQLPPSQFDRLRTVFNALTFTDELGRSATDDPGF